MNTIVAMKVMLKNNYLHEKKAIIKEKIVTLVPQWTIRIRGQKSLKLGDNQYRNNI